MKDDYENLPLRESVSAQTWAHKVHGNYKYVVEYARKYYRGRWGKKTSKHKPLSSKR